MALEWKPVYETGVKVIDDDHRLIVGMINELGATLNSTRVTEVPQLLSRLGTFFSEHCLREEEVMRAAGSAALEERIREHRQAKVRLTELAGYVASDASGTVAEAVVKYLSIWFVDHVIGKDLQLGQRRPEAADTEAETSFLGWTDARLSRLSLRTRVMVAAFMPLALICLALAALLMTGQAELRGNVAAIASSLASALALSIAFAAGTVHSVVRPFSALTRSIATVANGAMDAGVSGVERRDEIGAVARIILIFRSGLLSSAVVQADQAVQAAFRTMRIKRRDDLTLEFDNKVLQFVSGLSSSSNQLVDTANEMTRIAGGTTNRSTTVAAASEQTSTNIQTVASAVEELTASVGEISRQVTQATNISETAVGEAGRADGIVGSLAEAVGHIGDIVALIEEIASQTNLLALNATIEAARAGEAGKGFAVVAQEVKQLANQTVRATSDIGGQIKTIQEATGAAVTALQGIGGTIRELHDIAGVIAVAVEQQGAATHEISRNLQEASQGVGEVTRDIAEVSHGATQTSAAASKVLQAANDLSSRSDLIRTEVESFLSNIQAT